jgi:hypothetical protein
MQLALASPLFRSVAVGGLLLALSVSARVATRPHHKHHLVLHTYAQPGAFYLTAWRHGHVAAPSDGDALVPLRFTTVASVNDGCRWQGIETLEPIDGHRYAYRYDETILSCEPDAVPFVKTPRTGLVTIEADR